MWKHSVTASYVGPGHDTRNDLFQNRRDHIWGKHAGTATLRDVCGYTVDTMSLGRRRH